MAKAYGIDFGTTNSTIALVEGDSVFKIPVDSGAENPDVMRSIIYVNNNLGFLYGKSAIAAYGNDVSRGKGRVKKLVYTGRYITVAGNADIHGVRPDEVVEELIEFDEFQGGRMIQSLKSVLSNKNINGINIFGKKYTIEEMIGGFIAEMKHRADKIVGKNIDSVVVGRPVRYVGDDDKSAMSKMQKALKLAGFKDIMFEFEPVAAAYDYENRIKKPQTVLIFDFGGGTLDISVVRFPDKAILANVGMGIGGDYFNSKIFASKVEKFFGSQSHYGPNKVFMPYYIYEALKNWYSATLLKDEKFDEQMDHFRFMSTDPKSIDALRSLVNNNLSFSLYDEIDRVKRKLTDGDSETLVFKEDHIDIETAIKRTEFEEIIKQDVFDIDSLIGKALNYAGIDESGIDAVSTTGGSSLIPIVRKLLTDKFGKEKIIESDAFTSVAAGLALRADDEFAG